MLSFKLWNGKSFSLPCMRIFSLLVHALKHLCHSALNLWQRIAQQVPPLSEHTVCDTSTGSTDSSNNTAPEQGNLLRELLPAVSPSTGRTLTLLNTTSPLSCEIGLCWTFAYLSPGWQHCDWCCLLDFHQALKHCLISDVSLTSGALLVLISLMC